MPPHRVVWVRKLDDPRDTWLRQPSSRLMGFDSEAGVEMVLLPGPERLLKPLFTPDGEWVVFSTSAEAGPGAESAVVERIRWDGTDREVIAQGMAVDTLLDSTGQTWIYIAREVGEHGNFTAKRIERVPWDDPGTEPETVWDQMPVTVDNIQFSADGRWMSGSFPWPEVGRVDLKEGRLEPMEQGCWPSMAPDASGLMWVFDGRHRNVRLMLGDEVRPVRINDGQDMDGFEVYHPRWSNHPLYLACTGPYLIGETDVRITGGGEAVGIMIGRFDPALTKVQKWWRITGAEAADFYPDLWVSGGEEHSLDMDLVKSAEVAGSRTVNPTLGEGWPPSDEGLLLRWDQARASNEWIDTDGTTGRLLMTGLGNAVLAADHSLQLWGGAFTAQPTVGESLAAAARSSNQFTWSGLVTADQASTAKPARVFSLSTGVDERNFSIDQVGDRWVVRWRTMWSRDSARDTEVDIGPVAAGQPTHLVISYDQPDLRVWIDGEGETHRRGRNHDLGNWTPQEWIVGNEWGGGAPWRGQVQAMLWYDRAFEDKEAGALFETVAPRLAQVQEACQAAAGAVSVRATLLGANPIPDLADIHPYQSHLEVFSWRIEEVLEGSSDLKGQEVEVLQWVILNGQNVPASQIESGEAQKLRLSPVSQQPQLEGSSQGTPEVDRLHLPLYYRNDPPGQGWQGVPEWNPVDN